jgi:hypothetical protein
MISFNKGEWSEVYTLIKLLADGKLYAADQDLNRIEDIYYPLIKILRSESDNSGVEREYEYYYDEDLIIRILDGLTGNSLVELTVQEFREKSLSLFQEIRTRSGRSFEIPGIEDFLMQIKITKPKERSSNKRDITIVVHDIITGFKPTLGFSIKSKIGQPATLLNASRATNFIYRFDGPDTNEDEIKSINDIHSSIKDRIYTLESKGYQIKFLHMQNDVFKSNLQMIDTVFPQIISDMLLNYCKGHCGSTLDNLVSYLETDNPCSFSSTEHPFYRYKIKNFLIDIALGMRPSETWRGVYDANGGYIVVRNDGELVCYHVYNRNEFQEYLLKNTRLEQADRSRHNFGHLYMENGEIYINLNLQIRFR